MNIKLAQSLTASLIVLLSACAPARPEPSGQPAPLAQLKPGGPFVVHVKLSEFKIEVDHNTIPAGEVKFEIQNTGVVSHEMIIELPGDNDVALEDGGKAAEAQAIDPGKSATLVWKLDKPGMYHLSCHNTANATDHFKLGMMIPVTVTNP